MNKNEILNILKEIHDKLQDRPNQFVVAYFNKSTDKLIGYHLSTFCQITDDILEVKRYSAEDPYPQLEIIFNNVKYVLDKEEHDGIFGHVYVSIREQFGGLTTKDIYLDAIYLAEGTPKQDFRYQIIENE